MNLRPGNDSKNFPPCDKIPARILTEGLNTTAVDYEIRCCAFFAAIFRALREDLVKLLKQDPNDLNQVIRLWNNDMHVDSPETRNKFFERVDSEYKRVCKESSYGKVYADDDRFTIPLSLPRTL